MIHFSYDSQDLT